MTDSKVAKIFVRPDNTAVLTCPQCGRQKVILVDSSKGYKNDLKVKCVCQNVFRAFIEFRKNVRKKKNLVGTYINHSQGGSSGYLTTQDISLAGLTFTTVNMKNFTVGDAISLEFTLYNEDETVIKKEAIVRGVRKNSIGCEFKGTEEDYGSPLGYYVMTKLK